MLKVGGFVEYTPAQQLIFDDMQTIIFETYEMFAYAHIETPAVEKNEILLKWWEEASKQVFWLYGMATGAEDLKPYALRFDLTIPFTRYVLDHQAELVFPFKRYQIQKVRRGERQQKWRYKEFYQADIDVIWRQWNDDTKYLYYDAEAAYGARTALEKVREKYLVNYEIITHINNRNIMMGLFSYLTWDDEEKIQQLSKLFDSYYKLWEEIFYKQLGDLLDDKDAFALVQWFIWTSLYELDENLMNHDLFQQWVRELQKVFAYLDILDVEKQYSFVFDPFIMRWLDYYTGTVYENLIAWHINLGSICSGGRYANLTQAIAPKSARFDGVGMSIWLSRLFSLILDTDAMKQILEKQKTRSEYLLLYFSETFTESFIIVHELQQQGKIVEIYPGNDKLKKQFAYADKKGIKKVIICGQEELDKGIYKVKDMETGEEEECKR